MARLEDAWGAPKDRTPAQFVGMAREWFLQLSRFGERTVEQAITHVIGTHKYGWASVLPEIVMFCTRDDREWREVVELQVKALPAPAPEKFERDGRTREEEIEFRTQQIADMKRRHGFKSAADIEAEEIAARPKKEIPPAMEASEALLATPLVRKLRAKQMAEREGAANQFSESPTGPELFVGTPGGRNQRASGGRHN